MSQNILFCFDNYVGDATIVASSEADAVEVPVENLVNKNRGLIWRSVAQVTAGISESITVTLADPAEYPISVISLVDLLLSPSGTIRVQSWVDGIDGATVGMDTTYDSFASFAGFGVGGFGQGGYGGGAVQEIIDITKPVAILLLGEFREEAYWKITIADTQLKYTQASHLHVGTHWQPERNISKGFSRELDTRAELTESVGGQEYGDDRDDRLLLSGIIRNMDIQDSDYLWQKFMIMKKRVPFIVSARVTGTLEQLYTTKLMRFDTLKIDQGGHDDYSAAINLREFL